MRPLVEHNQRRFAGARVRFEHRNLIEEPGPPAELGLLRQVLQHLSNAEIIDVSRLPATGKVVFGATIDLEDQDDGNEVVYQIVGDAEADIKSGLISVSSPIARALVGKSQGDVVDVVAPNGTRTYEIVAVKYV